MAIEQRHGCSQALHRLAAPPPIPTARSLAFATVALLAAALGTPGSAESASVAQQRAQRAHGLEQLGGTWDGLGLAARLGGATLDAPAHAPRIAVGSAHTLDVRATRDAYLTVLALDAHGVLAIVHRDTGAPTPASETFSPRVRRVATPPIGVADYFVIATPQPLSSVGAPRVLAPAETDDFIAGLGRELAALGPGGAAQARAGLDVVGRSGQRGTRILEDRDAALPEVSTADIVAYYTSDRARVVGNVRLDLHVRFATDSAELGAEARASLDEVGRALSDDALAGASFRIGGHTDEVGAAEYNRALSERRAAAARAYLCDEWGVAPDRLAVRGYGEASPLELGGDERARALNRRVDFELIARGLPNGD